MYQPDIYHASIHIPISEGKVHVTPGHTVQPVTRIPSGRLKGIILASYQTWQHFPHSIDKNRNSCDRSPGQSTCLCLLVGRSPFICESRPKMVRTGTVAQQRASNPQTIGKASVKQTKQSEEGHAKRQVFSPPTSLMRRGGSGGDVRQDAFLIFHYTHRTHIRAHEWRLGGEEKPGRSRYDAGFPLCGLLNGSKYHRYELQQGSWFVVGSSCCLASHEKCFFSAGYVINKTAESICWQRINFPLCSSARNAGDLGHGRMFQSWDFFKGLHA